MSKNRDAGRKVFRVQRGIELSKHEGEQNMNNDNFHTHINTRNDEYMNRQTYEMNQCKYIEKGKSQNT